MSKWISLLLLVGNYLKHNMSTSDTIDNNRLTRNGVVKRLIVPYCTIFAYSSKTGIRNLLADTNSLILNLVLFHPASQTLSIRLWTNKEQNTSSGILMLQSLK